jgi:spore germination cell wall hydrolase CwlJ-like protein
MKMKLILGGVASSAVILASAFIYSTATKANAAVNPKEIVYIDRIVEVERIVEVPVKATPDPEAIFNDVSDKDRECLELNIYFESRGESKVGQEFVGWVTLNRVMDSKFPNTICDVVWQDSQFSWTHDGKSDTPRDKTAWAAAQAIAEQVINTYGVDTDPTEGSTYFHAHYVTPNWAKRFERVVRIDNHIFYADRG